MTNGGQKPKLCLMGHPRVEGADGEAVTITSKKGLAMLAMLATSDRGERSRVWLQQKLWGSRDLKQAQSSLRRELATLRKAFAGIGDDILQPAQRTVKLSLDDLWIDVRDDLANSEGEFLEGLDIAGEDDFEEWLREMRSGLSESVETRSAEPVEPSVPAAGTAAFSPLLAIAPTVVREKELHQQLARQINRMLAEGLSRRRWLPTAAIGSRRTVGPEDAAIPDDIQASHVLCSDILEEGQEVSCSFTLLESRSRRILWGETRVLQSPGQTIDVGIEIARVANCIVTVVDHAVCKQLDKAAHSGADHEASAWRLRYHLRQANPHDFARAEELFAGLDPSADGVAEIAFLKAQRGLWRYGGQIGDKSQLPQLLDIARRAASGDPTDARGPLFVGIVECWQGKMQAAVRTLGKSCQMDPGYAIAWAALGGAHTRNGEPEKAAECLRRAAFLAPIDPDRYFATCEFALALLLLNQSAEALVLAQEACDMHSELPLARLVELVALTDLGHVDAAREVHEAYFSNDPTKVERLLDWMPLNIPALRRRLVSRIELLQARPTLRGIVSART